MFNVSNTVPGFRVGTANDGSGRVDSDPMSASYEMLSPTAVLARKPYLRLSNAVRGIGVWEPSSGGANAAEEWISQLPSAVGDAGELCQEVMRAGPYCVYQCPSGEWVATPSYPSGPCPPFQVSGRGTFTWGDRQRPR